VGGVLLKEGENLAVDGVHSENSILADKCGSAAVGRIISSQLRSFQLYLENYSIASQNRIGVPVAVSLRKTDNRSVPLLTTARHRILRVKKLEDNAMPTRRAMLAQVSAAAGAAWAMRAGVAVGAAGRTAVDFDVPRGACDCHVHVFGDPAQFPFAEKRVYTPPPASVEQLLELQRDLHLDRVVVVQPSVYGADNACTLDAVRRMGSRSRGVAVIDRTTSRKALEEMAGAGIRGVRLNLETNTAGRFDPADAKAVLDATAEQIRGLGWHVQIYTRTTVIAGLKDHLAQMPFPVVVDHFGRGNPGQGPGQADFVALLDLVKSGRVYVKISGAYRVSEKAPDFLDVTGLAQALVAANPDRIVWGSDWPHPNSDAGRGKPLSEISSPFPIDDGLLLNQLPKWAPDAAVRKKILVDNPARLYAFEAVAG
jgi:predicted TIM-barrel fold metal-dependent hydrolase